MNPVFLVTFRYFSGQVFVQIENIAQLDHQLDEFVFRQALESIVKSRIFRLEETYEICGQFTHLALEAFIS